MTIPVDIAPRSANLKATSILDIDNEEVRRLVENMIEPDQSDRTFVQRAHVRLCQIVRPVYSVNEWQPVSKTLQKEKGSCSQRMACLEAIARAVGVSTRVRALHVSGRFWYPRFWLPRPLIPKRILLVWPGESLFEAIQKTPVDFLGKSCGLACAKPEHDLSKFVLNDEGFFDTRDEAFERFGSFQNTLRGRAFELVFGGRKSS